MHACLCILEHVYTMELELGEMCNVGVCVCGNMHESVYIFPGAPPAVDPLERCCASIDSRASCIFSERGRNQMTC